MGPVRIRLIPMQDPKGKPGDRADAYATSESAERRRVAKVVRDDRGNATVEWVAAPADLERPPLSVDDHDPARRPGHGYDPYQRVPKAPRDPLYRGTRPEGAGGKRDLRRLSDWIKQMRELETRKRRDED